MNSHQAVLPTSRIMRLWQVEGNHVMLPARQPRHTAMSDASVCNASTGGSIMLHLTVLAAFAAFQEGDAIWGRQQHSCTEAEVVMVTLPAAHLTALDAWPAAEVDSWTLVIGIQTYRPV